jgi:hypothetical protein
MGTDFSIIVEEGYIRVTTAPDYDVTLEGLLAQYEAIGKACKEHGYKKVLVEGQRMARHLSSIDAFRSGSAFANMHLHGLRMALCYPGYEPDETTEFFITVAKNRGIAFAFFQSTQEALRWLGIGPAEQGTPSDTQ